MDADDERDHGARLSDEEYQRGVVALQTGLPPMPSREQDREIRRKELDLAIDHRLGRDFPVARREALWATQERVEKRRLRLALASITRRLLKRSRRPEGDGLAGFMVDEYRKVLAPSEVDRFFALKPGERPVLPGESGTRAH